MRAQFQCHMQPKGDDSATGEKLLIVLCFPAPESFKLAAEAATATNSDAMIESRLTMGLHSDPKRGGQQSKKLARGDV